MQDGERKISIHFGIKRSKVKVTTEHCLHFGSDTITSVVFNEQLSYFVHRCRMVRGRYLFILWFKGQGQKLNFVNTLVLTRKLKYVLKYSFHISYIDAAWWEEDNYTISGQGFKGQGHHLKWQTLGGALSDFISVLVSIQMWSTCWRDHSLQALNISIKTQGQL